MAEHTYWRVDATLPVPATYALVPWGFEHPIHDTPKDHHIVHVYHNGDFVTKGEDCRETTRLGANWRVAWPKE